MLTTIKAHIARWLMPEIAAQLSQDRDWLTTALHRIDTDGV